MLHSREFYAEMGRVEWGARIYGCSKESIGYAGWPLSLDIETRLFGGLSSSSSFILVLALENAGFGSMNEPPAVASDESGRRGVDDGQGWPFYIAPPPL